MSPRDLKAALRKERLALRDAMSAEMRIEASLTMADHAGDVIALAPGHIVSGFWPIRSEVDIRPLMARLKQRGARLCLPVIMDKQTIIFRELLDIHRSNEAVSKLDVVGDYRQNTIRVARRHTLRRSAQPA